MYFWPYGSLLSTEADWLKYLSLFTQRLYHELRMISHTHDRQAHACFIRQNNTDLHHSVVFDSLQHHGLQPTRLLRPWDFPGKRTGVGCHGLLPSPSLLVTTNFALYICDSVSLLPYSPLCFIFKLHI